jgi:hypothetical protein
MSRPSESRWATRELPHVRCYDETTSDLPVQSLLPHRSARQYVPKPGPKPLHNMPWLRYSSLSSAGQWGQHEVVIVTILYACQARDIETIHLPTSRSGFGKQMNFYCTEKHKYNKSNRNPGLIRKSLCSKVLKRRRQGPNQRTKWPSTSVTLVIITICMHL